MCQNTPQLASAVEIALSGQMYLVEGQYEAAVEKYKVSLNLLEKLLEKEPSGVRYNLLIKQVYLYYMFDSIFSVIICKLFNFEITKLYMFLKIYLTY